MTPNYPAIFLVELMSSMTGELEDADVYARLDTAVEKAFLHAAAQPQGSVRTEVSTDDAGAIDGVGFFDQANNLIGCVTVYCLDRDTEEPSLIEVAMACLTPPQEMQDALNALLCA